MSSPVPLTWSAGVVAPRTPRGSAARPPASEPCMPVLTPSLYFFFFFQAEDGIRDYKVTGVQTCALPISAAAPGGGTQAGSSAGAIVPRGGALVLVAPGGSTYHVLVGPVHDRPHLFGELELPGVPLTLLAIALGVSGAVCYFLARYLAAPVDRLRLATRRLAAGDLNVRVLPGLQGRQDGLGLLAAGLDTMAEPLALPLQAEQQ